VAFDNREGLRGVPLPITQPEAPGRSLRSLCGCWKCAQAAEIFYL